jgi:hypothetical protein
MSLISGRKKKIIDCWSLFYFTSLWSSKMIRKKNFISIVYLPFRSSSHEPDELELTQRPEQHLEKRLVHESLISLHPNSLEI